MNTRAYRPNSGPGAEAGWLVEDAGASPGVAVALIVMTANPMTQRIEDGVGRCVGLSRRQLVAGELLAFVAEVLGLLFGEPFLTPRAGRMPAWGPGLGSAPSPRSREPGRSRR